MEQVSEKGHLSSFWSCPVVVLLIVVVLLCDLLRKLTVARNNGIVFHATSRREI